MSMASSTISVYPHHHQQPQFGYPTLSRTADTAESLLVSRTTAALGRYAAYETAATPAVPAPPPTSTGASTKDYSRPLHVDCSVEYELPNTAKPPQGVRNEPLLMIHPCYFRKIESQRRSPFVNNLPATAVVPRKHRHHNHHQQLQLQQQQPQLGAQYPTHYQTAAYQEAYCKRTDHHHHHQQQHQQQQHFADCWTTSSEPVDRSPDRPDRELITGKHLLATTGKYRQYMSRAHHRLHPYSAIPLASTFPQVCYNV